MAATSGSIIATQVAIEGAFANVVQLRANALVVASDPFFFARRQQLIALAARHAVPAIYEWRDFVDAGGLMSYGPDACPTAYRQAGVYAGSDSSGADKPADSAGRAALSQFRVLCSISMAAKALGLDSAARRCFSARRRGDRDSGSYCCGARCLQLTQGRRTGT